MASDRSRSPVRSRSPRRSITPRSRSPSRTPRRNGRRESTSRRRSDSRSLSRGRSPTPIVRSTKIVVERLTKNVNEDHLREIFSAYGQIRDLDVPLNRQFNTNRGTAYILYASEVDAEAAIAHMHESQLDGVTINVSIVLPRRKFSPSPPLATRGANHDPRRLPAPRGHGGPPPRRGRSPRGYGRSDGRAMREVDVYRPRSASRSRSPRRHQTRSKSYSSRSRTPPRRREGARGGTRDSAGGRNGNRRRRSPSYSSYSSYDDRSRSPSRSPSRR